MPEEKYNGWTNRETWLVNLWCGDNWETPDDVQASKEFIEDTITELPSWIQDFIYQGAVNWDELEKSFIDSLFETAND